MKNVWKGLVVGGLTGVAAGAILDLLYRGSGVARTAGKRAADRTAELAPKAADRLKSVATTGAAKLQDAELGEHVKEIAHRLADAEATDHAREKLEKATKKGAELAHALRDSVPVGKTG
jgi:hypothetical protein